jgi:hypothetical protein
MFLVDVGFDWGVCVFYQLRGTQKMATVEIAHTFKYLLRGDYNQLQTPMMIIASIDPITGERVINLYSDDGNGNGEGILTITYPVE